RLGLARRIDDFGRVHLHAKRKLVGGDAGGQLVVVLPQTQMLLIELTDEIERAPLLRLRNAGRRIEIANRRGAAGEDGPLVGGGVPCRRCKSGFGSNSSRWLGPPDMNRKITRCAVAG